jgi:hypothetical protein
MGEGVGPLAEFHRLHARFIEQDRPLENVHRGSIQPGTEVNEPPAALRFPFDHGSRGFAGETSRMEEVVVHDDADRSGPFQGGEGRLERTSQRIVKGQEPGGLACPKDKVRESFGPIGEGTNDEGLRRRHAWNLSWRYVCLYP